MRTSIKTMTFFCFLVIASCKEPVAKPVSILDDPTIAGTEEYKTELAKQLQAATEGTTTYTFEKLEETNGKGKLYITIEGETFDAIATLTVNEWDDELRSIRKTKGMGYRGAELVNLKIETDKSSGSTEFIYKGMDDIVD